MTDHHSPDHHSPDHPSPDHPDHEVADRDLSDTPAAERDLGDADLPEHDLPEHPAEATDGEPLIDAPAAAHEPTVDLTDEVSADANPVETTEADRTDEVAADTDPIGTTEADAADAGDTADADDGGGADGWAPPPPHNDPPPSDPPPSDPPPPSPPIRRLRRADASSGPGVAAGIARYFGIETGLVKAAFVVASFFGGLGIFVYIAAWALIPSERHPDPRPVVMNGSVAGIVIGTLAMVGAVSVAFGAGGFAGSLLAPALLIGIGFYLLDQRSTPQVMTETANRPPSRPSWIPPLTTTPLPPEPPRAMGYADTSTSPLPGTDLSTPAWGTVLTEPATPYLTAKPKPPVTAVTMAITALVVATLIGLDQFTSVDVSVPQMFGAALGIIVFGIVVSLFVGRALGLWFAGLIALIGWAVSPIAVAITEDGVGSRQYTVVDGSDLETNYTLGTGELIVDLRDASFTSDAATQIDLYAGSIVVYLPDDVTIDLRADAEFGEVIAPIVSNTGGPGTITDETSGPGSEVRRIYEAREGAPTVRLDVDVRFGSIEIRR